MALGAGVGRVTFPLVQRTLVAVLLGIGAGLVGFRATADLISSQLYGIEATDPLTVSAASAGLAVVAMLASLIPAFRAAHLDPTVALRSD